MSPYAIAALVIAIFLVAVGWGLVVAARHIAGDILDCDTLVTWAPTGAW